MRNPLEPHEATLQHIELLADKRDRLTRAQAEAEDQLIHRIAVEYHAGRLNEQQLFQIVQRIRPDATNKFGARWKAAMPEASIGRLVALDKVRVRRQEDYERFYRPNAEGFWSGSWPLNGDRWPDKGQCVVYVLYDAESTPCYVGSTNNFYVRAGTHAREGKEFVHWMAHPCKNRGDAYVLETRLLQQHKPYLNKRASA